MDDFNKILNDAKFISEAMEGMGQSSGANNSGGANMPGNIYGIMNMIDILKSVQSLTKGERPAPKPMKQDISDNIPDSVKALKAMAPYLGDSNSKNIMIASKLIELMFLVNSLNAVGVSNVGKTDMDSRNILIAARPYVDRDKQDMVDLLITVMEISEILKKMERMNNINAFKI